MKTVAALLLAGLTVGCASTRPERTDQASNEGYKVDQLFTDRNGYTVYRFWDRGEALYYVVGPKGEAQMVPSTRQAREGATVGVGVGIGMGIR